MKRLFILASAAIVALASCTKTSVVYTEAPEEISFKAVTGAMTKTALGENTAETMGVIAHTESALYFGNTSFSDRGTFWGTSDEENKKYWPNEDLTFTIYAPYVDGIELTNENSIEFEATDVTTTDLLYGTTRPTSDKNTAASGVPVDLDHAAAKVVFTFTNAEQVATLKSVTLVNVYTSGECTVKYANDNNSATVSWVVTGDPIASTSLFSGTQALSSTLQSYQCRVVPEQHATNTPSVTFTYVLKGSSEVLSHTIPSSTLGTWVSGSQYTYAVTIGTQEITITPSDVDEWTEVTGTSTAL